MAWRQYIQRMTEKGMQEEAMAETVRLHQDAEQARDKYGLACGEMCIGYNHRVFGTTALTASLKVFALACAMGSFVNSFT